MQKYARVIDDHVVETFTPPEGGKIGDCFHPDIAAEFIPCGQAVGQGWTVAGGKFTAPGPVVPEEATDGQD